MAKCPTKWKRAMSQAEAKAEANRLNGRLRYQAQVAYPCGDHWHIGNPRVKRHKRAMARKRASGHYDAKGRRRAK